MEVKSWSNYHQVAALVTISVKEFLSLLALDKTGLNQFLFLTDKVQTCLNQHFNISSLIDSSETSNQL
jgi:hypothetical protein